MDIADYIVVGSGCTGAMAAQTLVEAGVAVTMIDVGVGTKVPSSTMPDMDFITIRKSEPDQYRYFLGENAEGIAWGKVKTGEHLTPPRKHILQSIGKYLPIESDSFFPMESLA